MNPASDALTSLSRATAASPPAICARSRARPSRRSTAARTLRSSFRRQTSGADRHRFSRLVDDVLARLPSPRRAGRARRRRQPRRAAPAARNSAWSRAKSRCCRGTGNGWRSNRRRFGGARASWSTRRGAPARTRTASASAQEAAYRFMSAMAGNKPHYEEAIRALFAAMPPRFRNLDRRLARGRARPRARLAKRRIATATAANAG